MMIKSFGTNQIWHKSTMMIFTEKSNDDNKRIRNKERKKNRTMKTYDGYIHLFSPLGVYFDFCLNIFIFFFVKFFTFLFSFKLLLSFRNDVCVCVCGQMFAFPIILINHDKNYYHFFLFQHPNTIEFKFFHCFFFNSYFNNSKLFVSQLNDSIFWLWQ